MQMNSVNTIGVVTHWLETNFLVQGHSLPTNCYVANLSHDDAILGMPWICWYNSMVDWDNVTFHFDPKQIKKKQAIQEYQWKNDPLPGIPMWRLPQEGNLRLTIRTYSFKG